ncbi:MAG: hypothetical protein KIT02_11940 [Devosia sp.]|uniref:hypothetical protein n=1 Tax=Devosia sp. TaxID=1871048 RepID=UPI0024CA8EF4|nr:hypothetical protein [Devosia sp.]UYN98652.1 MAG: hypothetical protein KIT02_11940 [Devosia sp.]
MRISLALAAWSLLATAAAAQPAADRVTVLYCYGGNGCQAYLTPFSYEDMDRLLDKMGTLSGEGRGKPVVFLENNAGEQVDYVDMQRTPEEINVLFGGTGAPHVITTYPDLGGLQPRDGAWSVTMGTAGAENCPPGVENAMSGLKLAEAGSIRFATPFDPGQALPDQSVDWIKIAPNRYRAALPGSDAMFATYDLVVDGTESLSGALRAVTLVPGQKACTITLPVTYQRLGD